MTKKADCTTDQYKENIDLVSKTLRNIKKGHTFKQILDITGIGQQSFINIQDQRFPSQLQSIHKVLEPFGFDVKLVIKRQKE